MKKFTFYVRFEESISPIKEVTLIFKADTLAEATAQMFNTVEDTFRPLQVKSFSSYASTF